MMFYLTLITTEKVADFEPEPSKAFIVRCQIAQNLKDLLHFFLL